MAQRDQISHPGVDVNSLCPSMNTPLNDIHIYNKMHKLPTPDYVIMNDFFFHVYL